MNKIHEPDQTQLAFSRCYPELILASGSPNRRALIEKGGTKVKVFIPEADESRRDGSPYQMVREISERKIQIYKNSHFFNPCLPAISADTLVLFDAKLLGKPLNAQQAMDFYYMLSGKEHEVLTGVSLYLPETGNISSFTDVSKVVFKKLSEKEIKEYLATDEYKGAAGGYRFQKTGYRLIERIEGDWTNVVGLPLKRLIAYRSSI